MRGQHWAELAASLQREIGLVRRQLTWQCGPCNLHHPLHPLACGGVPLTVHLHAAVTDWPGGQHGPGAHRSPACRGGRFHHAAGGAPAGAVAAEGAWVRAFYAVSGLQHSWLPASQLSVAPWHTLQCHPEVNMASCGALLTLSVFSTCSRRWYIAAGARARRTRHTRGPPTGERRSKDGQQLLGVQLDVGAGAAWPASCQEASSRSTCMASAVGPPAGPCTGAPTMVTVSSPPFCAAPPSPSPSSCFGHSGRRCCSGLRPPPPARWDGGLASASSRRGMRVVLLGSLL